MARILIIILTLFVTHFTTLLSECSKLESASRAWLKRISFSQSVLICHLDRLKQFSISNLTFCAVGPDEYRTFCCTDQAPGF
jgi:hypothetical protein